MLQNKSNNLYFYLFCSFDIVNSTKYKYHSDTWLNLINKLYSSVNNELYNEEGKKLFKVWKYIGDEVVVCRNINNPNSLIESIHKLISSARNIEEEIDTFNNTEGRYFKVSIKTTIWCAFFDSEISILEKSIGHYKNIILKEDSYNKIDFLGEDMDTGFKLSKYSFPGCIIISSNLAYLLIKFKGEFTNFHLRIISFKVIKGVWDDSLYPIISVGYAKEKLKEKIPLNNDYVENIKHLDIEVGNDFFDKLGESTPAFKKIMEFISNKFNSNYLHVRKETNFVSLDGAVICFRINNDNIKEVFLAKRRVRVLNAEKWIFGGVEIRNNKRMEEALIFEYQKDFGFQIELLYHDKIMKRPIIINNYFLKCNSEIIHGLIFVGYIKYSAMSLDTIKEKAIENGYRDVKFISIDKLDLLNKSNCVDDMKENISLALESLNKQEVN